MYRNHHRARGTGLLAACLACLTGCAHLNDPPGRPTVSLDGKSDSAAGGSVDQQVALGRRLERQGDQAGALDAYQQALRRDPRCGAAAWRLAVLCDRQGRWKESAEYYRKALEARPGSPDLYCDMGYSLYLQHRLPEAEANLRQALALAPDNRRAHNNLGLVLARSGREAEALVEFRTGQCDVADAHANLAFALAQERQWDEARAHYERALALDPSCDTARTGLREMKLEMAKARPGRTTSAADEAVLQAGAKAVEDMDSGSVSLPPRSTGP